MRYVAYYRVSTSKQGESGLGLEAQQKAVADFLATNEGEVIDSFTEVESGKADQNRPQLHAALTICRQKGARLLIAKLDRLARNVHFVSGLMENGKGFVAADMPDADPFRLHIEAAIAEEERRRISARTKAALQAAKARGVKLGNPTGDTSAAVAAVKTKAQQAAESVAPVIHEIRQAGIMSLHGIADALNARGIPTTGKGRWHANSVRRVLQRVERRGFMVFPGEGRKAKPQPDIADIF